MGIKQNECESKNCCWKPSKTDGTPWCYHSNVLPKCKVEDANKYDCGYTGIKKDECESRNCCWHPPTDPNQKGKPWCYYANDWPVEETFDGAAH